MSSKIHRMYGKRQNTESEASKLFDEMLKNDKHGPKAAKATGAIGRWGKQSFTSTRKTNTPPAVKIDADPFLFESGDDDSPKKRRSPRKERVKLNKKPTLVEDSIMFMSPSSSDTFSKNNVIPSKKKFFVSSPIKDSAENCPAYKCPSPDTFNNIKEFDESDSFNIKSSRKRTRFGKNETVDNNFQVFEKKIIVDTDLDPPVLESEEPFIYNDNQNTLKFEKNNINDKCFDKLSKLDCPPVLTKAVTIVPDFRTPIEENIKSNIFKRSTSLTTLKRKETSFSKRVFLTSPKKEISRARYNHRIWTPDEEETASPELVAVDSVKNKPSGYDFDDNMIVTSDREPHLKKITTHLDFEDDKTKVKVTREHKPVYTVVKEVRGAHECLEHGETDDYDTDITYILHSLSSKNPLSVRCLSATQLVTKCCTTAFRMHLRAHEMLGKIFDLLSDSSNYPSLGLCAAAMFYLLSKDRHKKELDKSCLSLLLKLLVSKPNISICKDYYKTLKKFEDSDMKLLNNTQSWVNYDLNASNLSLECLLSSTNQNVSEDFKNTVREFNSLGFLLEIIFKIVDEFDLCDAKIIVTKNYIFKKLLKMIKLIENLTYNNDGNQKFVVDYKYHQILTSISKILFGCITTLRKQSQKNDSLNCNFSSVVSCLCSALGLMMNVTHKSSLACQLSIQEPNILNTLFECIFSSDKFLVRSQVFEVTVCALGVLINFAEHYEPNRKKLYYTVININKKMFCDALVITFYEKEAAADKVVDEQDKERELDNSQFLSSKENNGTTKMHKIGSLMKKTKSGDLDDEETNFQKSLKFADKHMEECVKSGFIALLLGCLIQSDKLLQKNLRNKLKNSDFSPLIYMLKKLMGFLSLTTATTISGIECMSKICNLMQQCNDET